MSVVSSNMVMGKGNPRVVDGWVLLPLVAEPVGVFVPFCENSDSNSRKSREKVETCV